MMISPGCYNQHHSEPKETYKLRSTSRHTSKETCPPPYAGIYKSLESIGGSIAGSFSILNAMVANIVKTLNFNQILSSNASLANFSDPTVMKNYMEALTLTASTTFLTGIIQLLLGCSCLGFVTTYLPKTLIDAYLTAAALHVIVSQFTFVLGIVIDFHKGPLAIFYNLFHYFLVLPKANATSILLFMVCVVLLRVSKYIKITYKHSPVAFPMELLL
ncbi:PREDICTED: testis anion transporter 1, partial [Tinamus guttatus]|uniref:testis anion transporter 1 n=1 Tax=Tinamus guttatus TaxID=94827 RepID=UPI00052EFD97